MPFDLKSHCYATIYCNNCGLHCLTHLIVHKLETGELQTLLASNATPQSVKNAYSSILDSFQAFYELPTKPTWDQLNQLFQTSYTSPVDREVVMGSVLRAHLQKVFTKEESVEKLMPVAIYAFTDYLDHDEENLDGISAPYFKSNREYFESLKNEYETELLTTFNFEAEAMGVLPDADGLYNEAYEGQFAIVEFTVKNKFLEEHKQAFEDYWIGTGTDADYQPSEGIRRFAEYMTDTSVPNETEFVSGDQLGILTGELNIKLEVYTDDLNTPFVKIDTTIPRPNAWPLKLYNPSHAHWEFEEFNGDPKKAERHNEQYNENITAKEIPIEDVQALMLSLQPVQRPEPVVRGAPPPPPRGAGVAPPPPLQKSPSNVSNNILNMQKQLNLEQTLQQTNKEKENKAKKK